jgi:hypothetical protein
MLVALLEIPGSQRQQPDIDAVNALIPAAAPVAAPPAAAQPAVAVAPVPAPDAAGSTLDPQMESRLMRFPPEQREMARQQMLWIQQQMQRQAR